MEKIHCNDLKYDYFKSWSRKVFFFPCLIIGCLIHSFIDCMVLIFNTILAFLVLLVSSAPPLSAFLPTVETILSYERVMHPVTITRWVNATLS